MGTINLVQALVMLLVLLGAVILVYALVLIRRIYVGFADVKKKNTWGILKGLMYFFLASYILAAVLIIAENLILLELMLGVVFSAGAVFVYVVIKTSLHTLTELKDRAARFKHLTKEIQDYAIIMLDTAGNILSWNDGAKNIKGYSAEEIIGKNFLNFYSPEDTENGVPHKLLSHALINGRAIDEGYRVRKGGSSFWASVSLTAIHDNDGAVTGFVKVTRDLSERKAAQEVAEEHTHHLERQNSELEQFTYIASHDIQEPLNSIKTLTNILREDHIDNMGTDGKQVLDFIDESIARMSNLITGLLDYGRIGRSSVLESIDTQQLLEDVKIDLKSSIELNNATIESAPLPIINGHELEFRLLMQNLVGNGIKFRKQNEPPIVTVSAEEQKEHWLFSVKDNGIGIEKEYLDRIFILFQRLNSRNEYAGTGIGLAHCKKIVEMHGGQIGVTSEYGVGSNFYFTIPK